jgi:hypothetical protein
VFQMLPQGSEVTFVFQMLPQGNRVTFVFQMLPQESGVNKCNLNEMGFKFYLKGKG